MGAGATGLLVACVQPDTGTLRPDHRALQMELDLIRGAAQVSSGSTTRVAPHDIGLRIRSRS